MTKYDSSMHQQNMEVLEHDLTMAELRSRGTVPRMSVVPLFMLLSIKLKPDGSFVLRSLYPSVVDKGNCIACVCLVTKHTKDNYTAVRWVPKLYTAQLKLCSHYYGIPIVLILLSK